jgi:RNA polymerase primary sigma factor
MRLAALPTMSLDTPIGDEDSNSLGDVVQDESVSTPYEQLTTKTIIATLRDMVKTLGPRELTILRARFGLDGGAVQTLEEIGRTVGVTRERVRQVQNLALAKLGKMLEKAESGGFNNRSRKSAMSDTPRTISRDRLPGSATGEIAVLC